MLETLEYRFRKLIEAQISDLGIWVSDVPDRWLVYISQFLKNINIVGRILVQAKN